MKILFTALILAISINSFAQLSAISSKHEMYQKFLKTTTYVVKTGNPIYDKEIMAEMEKVWKVTPFEAISKKGMETKITDESASFLALMSIGNPSKPYHYLSLVMGGKKKISKITYYDLIAYSPINYYQTEMKMMSCGYRVKNMLQSMVQAMVLVDEKSLTGSSLDLTKDLQAIYNKRSSKIKDRTLLFTEETIKGLKKADIAAIYPYKFEIVKKTKIKEIIASGDDTYYYYQPTITLNKSMFIFDPVTGEVVYFSFKMQGLKIKEKDIEDLVRAIKTGAI